MQVVATHEYKVPKGYPNLQTALRKFVYLTVIVTSCEIHFSNLTIIKYYLRVSMGQESLNNG